MRKNRRMADSRTQRSASGVGCQTEPFRRHAAHRAAWLSVREDRNASPHEQRIFGRFDMAHHDYMPRGDLKALDWMRIFRNGIVKDPPRYGLTTGDGEGIARVVNDFETAYDLATDEATRTKGSIVDKNDARATAEHLCRLYTVRIKGNRGVADGDKLVIGVRPVNLGRRPMRPPSTFPLLKLLGMTPCAHHLAISDSSTPERAARPYGAIGLQLFIARSDRRSAPLGEARLEGVHTRSPMTIAFTHKDDGLIATYHARWMNAKGEPGPWSHSLSARIAA
jgi:hypothetical protein